MEKLKISVLYWEERTQGHIKHDDVVEQVARALAEGGHKVSSIGINDDLRELLDKLDDKRPDLVFNLCERFADCDDYEMNITAILALRWPCSLEAFTPKCRSCVTRSSSSRARELVAAGHHRRV